MRSLKSCWSGFSCFCEQFVFPFKDVFVMTNPIFIYLYTVLHIEIAIMAMPVKTVRYSESMKFCMKTLCTKKKGAINLTAAGKNIVV